MPALIPIGPRPRRTHASTERAAGRGTAPLPGRDAGRGPRPLAAARSSLAARASLVACALAVAAPAHAEPPSKVVCIDADERAQRARIAGHLREAHAQLVVCSQDACPGPLRAECAQWLREVDAGTPTVVFEARDASGRELTDVRVAVDGEPVAPALDGRAVTVDPGRHVFRYESLSGPAVSQPEVIREGEKNRRLLVTFADAPRADAAPTPPASPPPPSSRRRGGPPTAVYPLAALGVVGLAGFAFFGLEGNAKRNELRRDCAPGCSDAQANEPLHWYIPGDISLAVGLISLGVGAFLWASDEGAKTDAARRSLGVAVGPGSVSVGGSF